MDLPVNTPGWMDQPNSILRLEAILLQGQKNSFLFSLKLKFDPFQCMSWPSFLEFDMFRPHPILWPYPDLHLDKMFFQII